MKKQIEVIAASIANDNVVFIGVDGEPVLTLKRTDPRVADMVQQVVAGTLQGTVVKLTYTEKQETTLDKITKTTKNHIKFFQTNGKVDKPVKASIAKGFKLGMVIGKTRYTNCNGLVPLYTWAVKHNMVNGLLKFLDRVDKVAKTRRHSVVDMISFLSHTNLPITTEGNILAFKAVGRTQTSGVYCDIHTRLVKQSVGSLVQMSAKLVDPNRQNHCSDGLHIASQDYLGTFRGDHCLVVCIKPEDVYAVPDDTSTKMRVRAYQNVGLLSVNLYDTVLRGYPLDSTLEGSKLLNNLVVENFPPIKDIVDIGGRRGTQITYTKVAPEKKKLKKAASVKTVNKTESLVAESKKLVQSDVSKQAAGSRKDIANKLALQIMKAKSKKKKQEMIQELKNFKSKTKVSWSVLGIDPAILD